MVTVFWVCFLVGVLYTLVVVIFGDALAGALEATAEWLSISQLPIIQPTTIMGGLTVFGGAGVLIERLTDWSILTVVSLSFLSAALGIVIIYYVYVRPMANAEVSLSYSIVELIGRKAQVTVPIPAEGYGEVIIKTSGGIVNHIASSFDHVAIPGEATVVVVDLHDGVLLVSEIDLK